MPPAFRRSVGHAPEVDRVVVATLLAFAAIGLAALALLAWVLGLLVGELLRGLR